MEAGAFFFEDGTDAGGLVPLSRRRFRPPREIGHTSVSVNPRVHKTAMGIGVGEEAGWMVGFVPVVLSGLDSVRFRTWGTAFGTPG